MNIYKTAAAVSRVFMYDYMMVYDVGKPTQHLRWLHGCIWML